MEEKICGIYRIFNEVSRKSYIGQSIDIKKRWDEHERELEKKKHDNTHLQYSWNKYGSQHFIFSIIEECQRSDLNDREKYWIKEYDSFFHGYNMTEGGQDYRFVKTYNDDGNEIIVSRSETSKILTEQDVLVIIDRFLNGDTNVSIAKDFNVHISTIGKIRSHKNWCYLTDGIDFGKSEGFRYREPKGGKPAKKIDMYDINGVYLKSFSSFAEANKELGLNRNLIRNVCCGIGKTTGGYVFRYSGHPFNEFEIVNKNNKEHISVDQYDLNWNFIQTFNSLSEADASLGKSDRVKNVISGRCHTACGYYWLRHGEQPPTKDELYKIDQYDLNWNYICSYKSVTEASKRTNIYNGCIYNVLYKSVQTAGGYRWLYHNEKPPIEKSV